MAGECNHLHARTAPVVAALSGMEAVKGALCFGSYATGTCDEQSDVDLFVLCHPDLITPEDRQRTFALMDGVTELRIGCHNPVWEAQWCPAQDTFRLHGVLIEIHWNTVDWLRTVVCKVREEGAPSVPEMQSRAHTVLGLLENSVILLDPEASLRLMKSQLYPYPLRLKQALLRESWPVLEESLSEMRDCAERGIGNTALHFHLQRFLEALMTTIYALNERYDPGTKRVEQAYASLNRLPPDFLPRYQRILELPLTDSGRRELVRELDALTKELESMTDATGADGADSFGTPMQKGSSSYRASAANSSGSTEF